jgi:hypothetical protein
VAVASRRGPLPERLFFLPSINNQPPTINLLNVGRSMFNVRRDIICRPSRFQEDFPVELVEEWNVGNSDPWAGDEPF